ncbi:antitoxin [Rhodopseudomonas palustris]|uniref:antitoxin n=1 Tax=Rhodopseudomonas palustris TaxID=1076 RepID=UPI0021F2E63A|nr:hypothetical protein [Rhodopseudomonas palustris]UYO55813.1 hypothetical protein KQX61_10570 [Rhodopseudomonas palustris]
MTSRTAKIFTTDSGQAVELPTEFRFEGREVFVPEDFMGPTDRNQPPQDRDPFEGWSE